jgi:hypothetical protein
MLVLVMTLRLRAPWCHSLKEKRALLRPLISGLRRQFEAAVAESGHQDSHQLMEITLAVLVHHSAQGDSIREQVIDRVARLTEAELYEEMAEYR